MPRATRQSLAIDLVDDIYDEPWLIAERRRTDHGFEVLIGWPETAGQGGLTVVLTAALAEYLQAEERLRDIALPVSGTTIKRLRRALALSFDWDAWWSARERDLASMTLAAFAAKHNCSTGAACQRRAALAKAAGC